MSREYGNNATENPSIASEPRVAETSDEPQEYVPPNFIGSYAFHLTGNVFLPPPYDSCNGPFFRIGRFYSDGSGRIEMSSVFANYGGRVLSERYHSTYTVHPDGSFILVAANPPMPGVPDDVPHTITLEGVFADGGNKAVLGVTRFSVNGQTLANVGSVVSGEIIRQ